MQGEMPIREAISSLLSTQLLAAEVYSQFLAVSRDSEADLWKKMLLDELDHIIHIHKLLKIDIPPELHFPFINVERMREVSDRVGKDGQEIFLLRLEGALRLECAELDYGLEGMVARRLEKSDLLPGYPGDISEHLKTLLDEAKRYSTSPNIGMQVRRLTELLDTCMADTSRYPKSESDIFLRQILS